MKNINSQKAMLEHKHLIKTKGFLQRIYTDIYKSFKSNRFPQGPLIELGSGGGFIKDIIPKVITSDVIEGPEIDKVFFAEKMPFKSNSVAGFLMIDVFHHFKDPKKALKEMQRCLKPHGKIIMVEPYNSLWGRFIYQHFHHEQFNPNSGWHIEGNKRMSDANGAMPWIVFKRDYDIFQEMFPKLKLKQLTPHTPIAYLISGGLSKPQFLPTFMYKFIRRTESVLSPLSKHIGMFVTIELEKI